MAEHGRSHQSQAGLSSIETPLLARSDMRSCTRRYDLSLSLWGDFNEATRIYRDVWRRNCSPLTAVAQQVERVHRVAVLMNVDGADMRASYDSSHFYDENEFSLRRIPR
jgi:hypothetical protein